VRERRDILRFHCRKQQRFGCPWRLGGTAAVPFACFLTVTALLLTLTTGVKMQQGVSGVYTLVDR